MPKRKWISKAIKHPGALHKMLGVSPEKKIGAAKIAEAAEHPERFVKTKRSQSLLRRRARLAQTLAKF